MANQMLIGLVEDNPGDARLIQEMLREPPVAPFRVDWSSRLEEALAEGQFFWIPEIDGIVAGVLTLRPNFIDKLFLAPD